MDSVYAVLPDEVASAVKIHSQSRQQHVEEIRLRCSRPVELVGSFGSDFIQVNGSPVVFTNQAADYFLNQLSRYSIYALEEELKRGYITISGGHRVGIAGRVVTEHGKVKAIKEISSFNIRIARERPGIAEPYCKYLYREHWLSTLIIGPPQSGKTTLLRDIARAASTGINGIGIKSAKVGIVDERSEIAGCVAGIPRHELGERVDVLDACPKAEGMMMMIRSMSPELLIVDEIGNEADSRTVLEAIHAGIALVATVHGSSVNEVRSRPAIRELIDVGSFKRIVEMSRTTGKARAIRIIDNNGKELLAETRIQ